MRASLVAFLLWHFALITVSDALVLDKFGTKNTYNVSHTNSSISDEDLAKDQNCQLLHVIAVVRHGIRYPGADDIQAASRVTSQFLSQGANSALVDRLNTVVSRYLPVNMEKELSRTGAEEQQNLGSRVAGRYLKLFSSAGYEDVTFVASSSSRAKESCGNFSQGFAERLGSNASRAIETRDDLLRYFELCSKYVKEVRKNKTAVNEESLFRNATLHELNNNIAMYLNISQLTVSADDLNTMYKVAACEVAIVGSHYWTDLLRVSDLDLLEYADDLQQYWKLGYAYPINYQQSCPLLADIFHHMDDAIGGKKTKKGVFYFGHAETLLPLTTLLGLFNDTEQLRADNYARQSKRAFKGSRISSFSANLGFALYKCNSTATAASTTNSGYMVQVLHNEQPVQLPHVCAHSMCPYDTMRKYYSQFIDSCNFNATCSLSGRAADTSASAHIFSFLSPLQFIWSAVINTFLYHLIKP